MDTFGLPDFTARQQPCGPRYRAEVPYQKFWTQTTVYLPGYWSDPSTFGITCP
jgi:hypothetical protein